ncbi:MAG TPA: MMPL family transporter [Gaiellaceae bacterium]|nr:MMPL family transporter [Gaiellaceae bacterium]
MSTPKKHHIAARMGHWSATHRKTAIFGWLGFVIVAFAIGTFVVTQQQIVYETSQPGESGRAEKILYEDFKQPAGESILIQHPELRATSPAFQAVVRDVVSRVDDVDVVAKVESPLDAENSGQVSDDRHAVLVELEIAGESDKAIDKIDPVVAQVKEVQSANPDFYVGSVGVSTEKDVQEAFFEDLAKAGLISIPITLIILIVAFGALVAAGIPLLLGITAILATMGLISIWSQWLPMEEAVGAMVLLIGLAVGVDYSMFYLKREREERAKGRSEKAALEAAAATSGRSVLISGLTVLVAMSGMFLTGDATFASFGIATMTVVAIAMLGSLTVLPAVLSKLGDKVDRGRVPFVHRLSRKGGEGRIWGAIIDRVLKRPVISVVLSAGLLIALAIPAIQLRTAQPSFDTFPQNLLTTYNRLKEAFPGTEISAAVVVKAPNVEAPEVQEAIGQLEWRAIDSGVMNDPIDVDVNAAKTVATVAIPIEGDGTDATSKLALTTLRDEIVPVTVGTLAGAEVGVTGTTAQSEDFNAQMSTAAPLVFAFVLIFAFLLMLVSFRSIVIATKAVLLNLLSVGAAYGILVLVFQHGYGKQLLGFEVTGGIDPFLPVLLFVILFGLSMDYHVFILSRIREGYDSGMPTEAAISHGIKSTAGVVTSAAIVMVAVFSVFGALQAMIFKQFGVGLASAILIDATIVRAVLLPSTMKLLGDWNWYLPKWLEWLPHFEHGEKLDPVEAPAVPTPTA